MTDFFSKVLQHYTAIAQELNAQAELAGLLNNAADIGREREEVYRNFLERYLPTNCDTFLGGFIYDSEGNTSKQVDVIVTNGNAPRINFPAGNRYNSHLGGALAIAEIKSKINKNNLYDALKKCASLPRMPQSKGLFKIDDAIWEDIPYKVIVGYDGVHHDTLIQHITEFYEGHGDVSVARRPNLIHVLGKYMIVRFRPDMQTFDEDGSPSSDQPSIGDYQCFDSSSDALAIAWILSTIQENSFFTSHSMFNYSSWVTKIAFRIAT